MIYLATVILLLVSGTIYGAKPPQDIRALPVQYHGRTMPFVSFSREIILSITGKQSLRGEDPATTVLRWMSDPQHASSEELFRVDFQQLREDIGLEDRRSKYSFDELKRNQHLMHLASEPAQVRAQGDKPSRVQSEAEKIIQKMGAMHALMTYQIPAFIPDPDDPNGIWTTLQDSIAPNDSMAINIQSATFDLLEAFRESNTANLTESGSRLNQQIRSRWNTDADRLKRFDTEVTYNRYRPVQLGRTFYLISVIILLASLVGWSKWLVPAASWLMIGGLIAHTAGLLLRTYIGDRAPWSNFYESLITLAGLLVLIGLLFSKGKLRGIILGAVAFTGFLALYIADRAGLSPGVETLMPALQSYWLTIHVITIMIGYAAAALAMVLGHVVLGVEMFKPSDRELFAASVKSVYRAVQMAMLFIFLGTVLGAVWAHEAWGRYWGWDPKETWSLISWFGYLGLAHAYFAGWIKGRSLALASIGVFPLILMTYYGVNYLLSGLHSYAGGESATVPPILVGFLIVEAVVVYIGAKGWHRKLTTLRKNKIKKG